MRKTLTVVALAATTLSLPAPTHAATCNIAFASPAEESWVNNVQNHTDDATCLDLRWIYRNRPALRDEFPGNHVYTASATVLPSPAFAPLAARKWCRITTTEKYRAPIVPFGDHVLFSFTMTQDFSYDGDDVAVGTARFNADTTAAGFRWAFDGVVATEDFYIDMNGTHYQHQSDKWGRFSTDGFDPIGLSVVHSTLHTMIWVQGNGDWRTINTNGVAGCKNP